MKKATARKTTARKGAAKPAARKVAAKPAARTSRVVIDPIRVSVIDNRLDAISKEIGLTMLRTSRSPIFSEASDF
ncbi:MAG: hydantoinase B/oxoprolinase family protein, partial [Gammaproteobacteria bacterium]